MHIYLDANSTTRMDDRVRKVMIECFEANHVNPASQHQPGQRARRQIEIARQQICNRLGAGPKDRLIFTSGGTEANNLALIGILNGLAPLAGLPDDAAPELIISAVEHPSVIGTSDFLASRGFVVKRIPVDQEGLVLTSKLVDLITPQTRLVSVMTANNETGVIQNVEQIVDICRDRGIPVHSDAIQAVGKIPVDFQTLGVSALSLSAHKLHGPRGIGGLLITGDTVVHPMMFGGVQQLGQRPGTESTALACGFSKAVQLTVDSLDERREQLAKLRDLFEQTILAELPETEINGSGRPRLPHTSNLSFPGGATYATVNRQALMMAADVAGVAISTGSACASGSSDPSHVLIAMGCRDEVIESSVRVSIDSLTTRAEILEGASRITSAVKRLRRQKSGRK